MPLYEHGDAVTLPTTLGASGFETSTLVIADGVITKITPSVSAIHGLDTSPYVGTVPIVVPLKVHSRICCEPLAARLSGAKMCSLAP